MVRRPSTALLHCCAGSDGAFETGCTDAVDPGLVHHFAQPFGTGAAFRGQFWIARPIFPFFAMANQVNDCVSRISIMRNGSGTAIGEGELAVLDSGDYGQSGIFGGLTGNEQEKGQVKQAHGSQ